MKVIVVGCGRLGAELAYRLYQRGHEVSVVDQRSDAFNNLPSDFEGRINEGDAMNQDVLRRAGAETADALVVATNSDALNVVVAHFAKLMYKIPRIIARNYNQSSRPLFETFGVQMVSAASWGAQRMEEMIYYSDVRTVFSAGNGEVELYEIGTPVSWEGRTLKELSEKSGCTIVAVTRAGQAMSPAPEMKAAAGDVILFGATFDGLKVMRACLGLPEQED